jgi:hypothetical protein
VNADDRPVEKGSRSVLYHGTLTTRLSSILKEDRLRISMPGDPKVSLTTERSVAEYWACVSVSGDRRDHPDQQSTGVVLVLDGEKLLAPKGAERWSSILISIPLKGLRNINTGFSQQSFLLNGRYADGDGSKRNAKGPLRTPTEPLLGSAPAPAARLKVLPVGEEEVRLR